MKYGLVYWKGTNNIGDDIQAYAAMQFLPRVDYRIDREAMHAFTSKSDEPVAVILNGWFLFNTFNWPPSCDLRPLCTSMHFSEGGGTDYLDGLGGEYLRCFAPVGARDDRTLEILKEKNIPAEFSGCMTLTLPTQPETADKDTYICAADVPRAVREAARSQLAGTGVEVRTTAHGLARDLSTTPWDKRVQDVEHLLTGYQNARCVLTTRLHCALPCMAMGVPVLLLLDEGTKETRFGSFLPLLRTATMEDFCAGKVNFDLMHPPENKPEYKAIREKLITNCLAFIDRAEHDPASLPAFTAGAEERALFQTQLIQRRLGNMPVQDKESIRRVVNGYGAKQTVQALGACLAHLPGAVYKALKKRGG